jgi:hypothetical protein
VSRLYPNHWRYRFAAKMRFAPIFVGVPLGATGFLAAVTESEWLILFVIVLALPVIAPLANLGCHNCNYNLFLPYRGSAFSEYGDSWSHPDVRRRMNRWTLDLPDSCPKCGAPILTERVETQP